MPFRDQVARLPGCQHPGCQSFHLWELTLGHEEHSDYTTLVGIVNLLHTEGNEVLLQIRQSIPVAHRGI